MPIVRILMDRVIIAFLRAKITRDNEPLYAISDRLLEFSSPTVYGAAW
jgi:hypothetical protein